jgi:hypothetical protein
VIYDWTEETVPDQVRLSELERLLFDTYKIQRDILAEAGPLKARIEEARRRKNPKLLTYIPPN